MEELDSELDNLKPITWPFAIWTCVYVLFTDTIVYGVALPLFATYIGGEMADTFELSPKWEVVLTILLTFVIVYGTFTIIGETSYWKHLFSFEAFYDNLLQVRDTVNALSLVICIVSLTSAVEALIVEDKGMKTNHIGDGAGYVFFKNVCEFLNMDHSVLIHVGLEPPDQGTMRGWIWIGAKGKYENGAAYVLYWAMLTACIAKLVYFNTLFTYLRAMEIFTSMKPIFSEDDDLSYYSRFSRTSVPSKTGQSNKLDNDFAKSVKGHHQ